MKENPITLSQSNKESELFYSDAYIEKIEYTSGAESTKAFDKINITYFNLNNSGNVTVPFKFIDELDNTKTYIQKFIKLKRKGYSSFKLSVNSLDKLPADFKFKISLFLQDGK